MGSCGVEFNEASLASADEEMKLLDNGWDLLIELVEVGLRKIEGGKDDTLSDS